MASGDGSAEAVSTGDKSGSSRSRLMTLAIVALVVVAILVIAGIVTTSRGRAQVGPDGAYVGQATNIRNDRLTLETGTGSIRVDTWAVCGDRTRHHISEGQEIHVFASRDLFSYDAWRILDSSGNPACAD